MNDIKLINTLFRKEADVAGIEQDGQSSGKISTRNNVHALYFFASISGTGATRTEITTDIDTFTCRCNGKVILERTAEQLLDLFKYKNDSKGAFTPAGCIPVIFTRDDLPLAMQNNNFALGMLENILTYEITYKDVVVAIDKMEVFTEYDELAERTIGAHVKQLVYTRSFSSTGVQQIVDLPVASPGSAILAYHIVSGNISKFSVIRDNTHIYNGMPVSVMNLRLRRAGKTNQIGYTTIPFDIQNDLASIQPLGGAVRNWIIEPTWSSSPSGSYPILSEEVHIGI